MVAIGLRGPGTVGDGHGRSASRHPGPGRGRVRALPPGGSHRAGTRGRPRCRGRGRFELDVVVEGERTRPDVALLGVSSSTLDGVAVSAATMRERVPSCRVIVLTDDPEMRRCALRSRPARRLPHDVHPHGGADRRDPFGASGRHARAARHAGAAFRGALSRSDASSATPCGCSRCSAVASKRCYACSSTEPATRRSAGRWTSARRPRARTSSGAIRKLGVHSRLEAAMLADSRASSRHLPVPGSQAGSGGPLPLATGSSG